MRRWSRRAASSSEVGLKLGASLMAATVVATTDSEGTVSVGLVSVLLTIVDATGAGAVAAGAVGVGDRGVIGPVVIRTFALNGTRVPGAGVIERTTTPPKSSP